MLRRTRGRGSHPNRQETYLLRDATTAAGTSRRNSSITTDTRIAAAKDTWQPCTCKLALSRRCGTLLHANTARHGFEYKSIPLNACICLLRLGSILYGPQARKTKKSPEPAIDSSFPTGWMRVRGPGSESLHGVPCLANPPKLILISSRAIIPSLHAVGSGPQF
ncbi:hypothetical protein TRIATDRAFT_302200, partial [Trichoderma atroviride IMI 206040]